MGRQQHLHTHTGRFYKRSQILHSKIQANRAIMWLGVTPPKLDTPSTSPGTLPNKNDHFSWGPTWGRAATGPGPDTGDTVFRDFLGSGWES
jgi:hypothetical protein